MKTNKELLKRVNEMEVRFDEVTRMLAELEDAVEEYRNLKPELDVLKEYMDSGRRRADFEANEAGEIPAEVKRGVLSEDGLYDLLQDADKILAFAKEVLG